MARAKFNGTCLLCERRILKGSPIGRDFLGTWVHEACADSDAAKLNVASGETFRSRKPSPWKRR